MFYSSIINAKALFGNLMPGNILVFFGDIGAQSLGESGARGYGEDFVGEFLMIPEIIFESGPNDFGDAGLMSKNKHVVVVGGFESGEAKWLRDRTHDKNIGKGVDVAKFLTADKTSKDDVFGDAEIG